MRSHGFFTKAGLFLITALPGADFDLDMEDKSRRVGRALQVLAYRPRSSKGGRNKKIAIPPSDVDPRCRQSTCHGWILRARRGRLDRAKLCLGLRLSKMVFSRWTPAIYLHHLPKEDFCVDEKKKTKKIIEQISSAARHDSLRSRATQEHVAHEGRRKCPSLCCVERALGCCRSADRLWRFAPMTQSK